MSILSIIVYSVDLGEKKRKEFIRIIDMFSCRVTHSPSQELSVFHAVADALAIFEMDGHIHRVIDGENIQRLVGRLIIGRITLRQC